MKQRLLFAALLACTGAHADNSALPQLVHQQGRHALLVDGKPYTVLAAQLNNSSAWPQTLPNVWDEVLALHPNTLEAPIYWEQFEPSPGKFDTTNLDALINGARAHHLHLILLWFGSWKNGQDHYAPLWMRTDAAHYPRALDAHGQAIDDRSPYAEANLQADIRAFSALVTRIKLLDSSQHTVIMLQVENEPGLIGSIRDHSPAANRAFAGPIPADLASALHKPANSSWQQAFGPMADEAFTAYGISHYIDQVAAAGKAIYPLPMYVNTWLRYKTKHLPGYDYPSGGATWNVLDIWKHVASHIDLIGTDLYTDDYAQFTKVVGQYARSDNPAWTSETGYDVGNAPYLFHVLAKGGVGFSVFGVDHPANTDALRAAMAAHARNFGLIDSINRQVAQAAYQGDLQTSVERAGTAYDQLPLHDGWLAKISYGAPNWGDAPAHLSGNPQHDGHVLILPLAQNQYLVTGFNARVEFSRARGQVLRVEEGVYENGYWRSLRWWNGDQTDYGLNFTNQPVLLKVTLGDM